jgi:hypothetical protein
MIPALYRNFLTSKVVYSKVGSPQRRQAFEVLASPPVPVLGASYPFDAQRYAFVTEQAKRLSKDMSSLTKKTRFCSRGSKCDTTICQFAHNIDEWNTPFCLQQEFCLVPDCKKNHGLTKEEYIELHNIKVPEKKEKESLVCTQFCHNMKEKTPCGLKGCTFAHSLWEYKPFKCPFDTECTDGGCVKKHAKDSIFYYMERQGVRFEPWMLRAATYNNSEQAKRLVEESASEYAEWIEKWSDDFRRYEGEQELVLQFKHMAIGNTAVGNVTEDEKDSKDEESDDDMEVVTFRIGTDGKNTMSLGQILADERKILVERHFQQFETDIVEPYIDPYVESEESDDEHQLSEEESSNIMLAAVDLELDFETVLDFINQGKSHVIFEWHKRRFDVAVAM